MLEAMRSITRVFGMTYSYNFLPAPPPPLYRFMKTITQPCWTECLSSGKQPKKPQRACHTMPESPLRGP